MEVRSGTPYVIIGESRYGKPILDRAWSYDQPLLHALRDGLLAFDATVTSASDVDPPVDCALYRRDSFQVNEQRFDAADLEALSSYWSAALRVAVDDAVPLVDPLMQQLTAAEPSPDRICSFGPEE